jgi:hypothetical protein
MATCTATSGAPTDARRVPVLLPAVRLGRHRADHQVERHPGHADRGERPDHAQHECLDQDGPDQVNPGGA